MCMLMGNMLLDMPGWTCTCVHAKYRPGKNMMVKFCGHADMQVR